MGTATFPVRYTILPSSVASSQNMRVYSPLLSLWAKNKNKNGKKDAQNHVEVVLSEIAMPIQVPAQLSSCEQTAAVHKQTNHFNPSFFNQSQNPKPKPTHTYNTHT